MNILERFKKIRTFIFDVDGVLTNGELIIFEDGSLVRKMNVRDGYAMKWALQQKYQIAIITGGSSKGVTERLRLLGIEDIYTGVQNKKEAYADFLAKKQVREENILYMGDDIPDYEVMRRVGFPTCPQDAAPEILEISQYVSPFEGGAGCVRDVIEKVMRINGKWMDERDD